MTRMTMAALPMVEEIDGMSIRLSDTRFCGRKVEKELTHRYNIGSHCITEGEIPSDSNEYIQESRNTNASNNHSGGPKMRVVAYLVQD